MDSKEVLEKALQLQPEERFLLIEGVLKTLMSPIRNLTRFGLKKQKSVSELIGLGGLRGVPMEDVLEEGESSVLCRD